MSTVHLPVLFLSLLLTPFFYEFDLYVCFLTFRDLSCIKIQYKSAWSLYSLCSLYLERVRDPVVNYSAWLPTPIPSWETHPAKVVPSRNFSIKLVEAMNPVLLSQFTGWWSLSITSSALEGPTRICLMFSQHILASIMMYSLLAIFNPDSLGKFYQDCKSSVFTQCFTILSTVLLAFPISEIINCFTF